MKPRISGKDATNVAMETEKYPPVQISAPDPLAHDQSLSPTAAAEGNLGGIAKRRVPARVRKPSPQHDLYLAPTPDLSSYRARLRLAFGNTVSDEFVDFLLGKVVEALKPSPFNSLEEATFNAALAIIELDAMPIGTRSAHGGGNRGNGAFGAIQREPQARRDARVRAPRVRLRRRATAKAFSTEAFPNWTSLRKAAYQGLLIRCRCRGKLDGTGIHDRFFHRC